MRARNREINIFSISLLDILTGLLGAFLFLMLGLIPYYVKVSIGRSLSAEEQQQFEEMKKLVEKGLKGPLSEEEVKKLQDELDRLQKQNQQLHGENDRLQNELDQSRQDLQQARQDLDQAKQDLQQQKKETDFWSSQDGTVSILSSWDSPETDIDVFIMTPSGKIYGQKQEKLLGREVILDGSDSHGKDWKINDEGLLAYVAESGPYLVLYRIPKAAAPQSYSGLRAQFFYHQAVNREKNTVRMVEGTVPYSYSAYATPGNLYAWTVLNYDADKKTLLTGPLPSQLPPGVQPRPTPHL
jgi:TolA-binding protein